MCEHDDAAGPANEETPVCIVGVGASAGGLEALERLFEHMPAQTGMAFVVLQHLSPDFKSLTDELLARRTALPMHRAEDGMVVRRDAVYLLPPRKEMVLEGGRLRLTDKDPSQGLALPIDHFFRSLAREAGDRAVGIVLSGTGSDGSRGVREIHEAGGLVIAQKPETAKFDGMPRSAIQTGAVHFTLAPEDMPAALLRFIKHPLAQSAAAPAAPQVPESAMEAIFRLLRVAYDIDFSQYKPETVARRTERRLQLNHTLDLDDYVRRLEADPEELNRLYKDLLIGVTRFFRDRAAFERLGTDVLPALVRKLPRDEELRVWVAGCATGEEAYSVAILVQEAFEAVGRPVCAKVFATDAHRASLDTASAGLYGEEALAEVSPARRARFFVQREDGFQVVPELRKLVVFAPHNLLKDAPFTRLDLISCRNLLIYFQPAVQQKVLALFHFALKAGGALFLGPSESPGELAAEFETLDPHWKLYRKRRDVRLAADIRLAPPAGPVVRAPGLPAAPRAPATEPSLLAAYDALLNDYLPPSLLVNERRELLRSFNGASAYLRLKDGYFSADVLDIVDPELRVALSGALPRAFREGRPVVYKGLRVAGPDGERTVNVTVRPVVGARKDCEYVVVCLEELGAAPAPPAAPHEIDLSEATRDQVRQLEAELRDVKGNLQATIEELETSNEELQATNEELVASNEELQSTNEELHSVNEELYTVNAEHQKKIAELTELTADMDNLLASTEVHTVFLDRQLRIRKFTPRIAVVFDLMPQDVGRRIDSFAQGVDHPGLVDDIRSVLETGEPVERKVRDRRGGWYLLRVLPYRAGGQVGGAVLTLIDIGGLMRAEEQTRVVGRQLAAVLGASPNFLFVKDADGRYVLAGDLYRKTFGTDPVGKTAREVFPPRLAEQTEALDARVLAGAASAEGEVVVEQADGPHTYLAVHFPVRGEDGTITGISGVMTDVTALKRAESQAREALVQRDRFLAMLSHELRNPLAAIVNATHVLTRAPAGAVDTAEWLRVIERRSRHMARLLDDLLDVARITQGKIEVRRRPLDLAQTVPEVLEEVRPHFDDAGVELVVDVRDRPLVVDGDAHRLAQAQVNLLVNAVKHTPAGGTVTYTLAREGGEAVVRVRDTGCGIAPEMLDRVFDWFVQAGPAGERSPGGLGVGLTLVRSVVELHGGRVEAHSAGPGRGSEFVVRLPLAREEGGKVPEEDRPSAHPSAAPLAPSRRRVLVVEDDADIRASMSALLTANGYRVRTAADSRAALAALADELPDVALVDLGLPGRSGIDLAREVRQRWPGPAPRLVALTGYGRPADREATRRAGFDAHLTKPLHPDELYRLLDELAAAPDGDGRQNPPR